ncbi:hypothetical protein ACGF7U_07480 [Micromonospora sp. NPDC047670]|uniref:hypothetical protein n=1 Tax=Micromonospora sp. NPDC047670 TaxID=3364252 RepID=UPI003711F220
MTWSAVLLVTAVVWAVSLIRSVRLRAFVYSLPLPMTLALVTTGYPVDGAQLLGVLGLNLFFVTVAVTHHRWRWPILLADLAGVAAYVGLSAGLLAVPVPFGPALAGSVLLWVAAMAVLRRHARRAAGDADSAAVGAADSPAGRAGTGPAVRAEPVDPRRDSLPAPAKLVVIFVGAVLTGLLGQLLRGMVVTFPYSGVLVAVEARRQLVEFSRHFARNSLALVGFLACHHYLQDVSSAAALAGGWATFAVLALALNLTLRRPRRPGLPPGGHGPRAAPGGSAVDGVGDDAAPGPGEERPGGGAPADGPAGAGNGRAATTAGRNERDLRRPLPGANRPGHHRDLPVPDDLGRGR